jgi:hypothetical protein
MTMVRGLKDVSVQSSCPRNISAQDTGRTHDNENNSVNVKGNSPAADQYR